MTGRQLESCLPILRTPAPLGQDSDHIFERHERRSGRIQLLDPFNEFLERRGKDLP